MTSRVDLDYTLKQKILTLYDENHNVADAIVSKWLLPQINETNIASFVKLRNGKTHSGINVNIKMYIFDHLRMYIFAILPLDRYIFSIDRIFP